MRSVICITPDPESLWGASRSLLSFWENNRRTCHICLMEPGGIAEHLKEQGQSFACVFEPGKRRWFRCKLRVQQVVRLSYEFTLSVKRLVRFMKQCQAEVIYVNTVDFASPIVAGWLLRRPTIVHMRESPGRFKVQTRIGQAKLFVLKRCASQIICNSKAAATHLRSLGVSNKKLSVIYNGVDVQHFSLNAVPKMESRKRLGLKREDLVITVVARLTLEKGVDDFLEAAILVHAQRKSCQFIIVGGPLDSDYYRIRLEPIWKRGLTTQCKFVGDKADVRPYLSAADVVVVPSHEETFGRVNIEAMAMERPVVATAVGGIPEVIEHEHTGFLVPPASPNLLATRILQLLTNPELCARFGNAGRKRVEERFSDHAYNTNLRLVFG